jgi:hypothetical protein
MIYIILFAYFIVTFSPTVYTFLQISEIMLCELLIFTIIAMAYQFKHVSNIVLYNTIKLT